MYKEYRISLDLKRPNFVPEPIMKQNDDVKFIIDVFDDGLPVNLTNAMYVTFGSERPDGKNVVVLGSIQAPNTTSFICSRPANSVVGRTIATVQIYDDKTRVSTLSFTYVVQTDPSYIIPNDDDLTLIQQVLAEGGKVVEEAQQAIVGANTAANNANQAATAANTAATSAQTAATNAVNATTAINDVLPNVTGLENKTAWASNVQYKKNNFVTHKGNSYQARIDNVSVEPPTLPVVANAAWALMSQKGEPGTGIEIMGILNDSSELPTTGEDGQAYSILGDLWVWSSATGSWENLGPIKGEKGDPGPPGPQGIKGEKGDSGNVTVINNLDSTSGTDALSAYQGYLLKRMIEGANVGQISVTLSSVESFVTGTQVGQTVLEIPNAGFDPTKHVLLVFRNSTKVPATGYDISQVPSSDPARYQVTLGDPIEDVLNTFFNFVVLKGEGEGSGGGGGSSIALPISANDVTETSARQFISSIDKGNITSNSNDIVTLSSRVATLEQTAGTAPSSGQVKMNAADTLGYLVDKVDGVTITNAGNKLEVIGVSGVNASIEEINYLVGAKSSIQAQIDALTSITNVEEVVNAETDLPAVIPPAGTTILVRQDSTHGGATTFYMSNGTAWQFVSTLDSGVARDFTVNPLNIVTETTGILPSSRYEKPDALNVTFTDSSGEINATDVHSAIMEVFLKSKDLKTSIASILGNPLQPSDTNLQMTEDIRLLIRNMAAAITSKGVAANEWDRMEELTYKIGQIPNITVQSQVKRTNQLNVTVGQVQEITLANAVEPKDLLVTVVEFVSGGEGVVRYRVNFDATDRDKFKPNPSLNFDGYLSLDNGATYNMTKVDTWGDTLTEMYEYEIDPTQWLKVSKINVKNVGAL